MALIANTLESAQVSDYLLNAARLFEDYEVICQKHFEYEDIYLGGFSQLHKGRIGQPENIFGGNYDLLYRQNKLKVFTDVCDWVSYMKNFDFCLSARFHGGVASILADVPTIIFPIDSRMRELVEYHRIPYIHISALGKDILSVLDEVDLRSYLYVWRTNFDRFKTFLNINDICSNIFSEEMNENSLNSFYSCKAVLPISNFDNIPITSKVRRFNSYFGGKIKYRYNRRIIHEISD